MASWGLKIKETKVASSAGIPHDVGFLHHNSNLPISHLRGKQPRETFPHDLPDTAHPKPVPGFVLSIEPVSDWYPSLTGGCPSGLS